MNLHGIFPTEEELKEMIQMVDRNSNGTIDLEEFVQMMLDITKAIPEGENDIEQAFKIFDKVSTFYFILLIETLLSIPPQDGDGLITAEEIRVTMTGLGENLSETELTSMVAEADLNGDGYIDFSEFSSLMKNKFGLCGGSNISQRF